MITMSDKHRVLEFSELMIEKWEKGRAKYRNTPEEPFVGDPAQQLMDECVDLANYALEIYYRARSLGNRFSVITREQDRLDKA